MGYEFTVHRLCEFKSAQHFVLRFGAVSGLRLVLGFFSRTCHLAVSVEGLELDEISTRGSGSVNQLLGQSNVTVMVDSSFCNDESSYLIFLAGTPA